jgi:hypothetical protein
MAEAQHAGSKTSPGEIVGATHSDIVRIDSLIVSTAAIKKTPRGRRESFSFFLSQFLAALAPITPKLN